jgi:hypothetical protein
LTLFSYALIVKWFALKTLAIAASATDVLNDLTIIALGLTIVLGHKTMVYSFFS